MKRATRYNAFTESDVLPTQGNMPPSEPSKPGNSMSGLVRLLDALPPRWGGGQYVRLEPPEELYTQPPWVDPVCPDCAVPPFGPPPLISSPLWLCPFFPGRFPVDKNSVSSSMIYWCSNIGNLTSSVTERIIVLLRHESIRGGMLESIWGV